MPGKAGKPASALPSLPIAPILPPYNLLNEKKALTTLARASVYSVYP